MPDLISTSLNVPVAECPTAETFSRDGINTTIRGNLNDEGVKYYSPTDLNDSIQDAYDEIAAVTGCIEKVVTVPWEAFRIYYDFPTLIEDFLALKGIFNGRIRKWMVPTNSRELDSFRIDWELTVGEPEMFYPVNWRWTAFYPTPRDTRGDMHVWYAAQADILAGVTIPNIPPDWYTGLEYYVTADMLDQSEEYTKAGIYWKRYFGELDAMKKDKRSRRFPDKLMVLGG